MLISEPPRTNYDVHFAVAGIPVRIHPLFWLTSLLLGVTGDEAEPIRVLLWIGCVLVSILVHELGHAFLIRHYGYEPRITLYSLGGLASYETRDRNFWEEPERGDRHRARIAIAAGGPAAGFLFAGLVILLLWLAGKPVEFSWGGTLGVNWSVRDLSNLKTQMLVDNLIYINIFWGLINLLPVFPLDGGQISRELLTAHNPQEGLPRSLWISIITGSVMAALSLVLLPIREALFPMLVFGVLAYTSYVALKQVQQGGFDQYGSPRDW